MKAAYETALSVLNRMAGSADILKYMSIHDELKKNLHLSYKDRCIIQEFLTYGYSFTAIANRIQKDRTTMSKEIRNLCFVKPVRGNNEVNCSLLLKPPYVCNGCENSSRCKQPK